MRPRPQWESLETRSQREESTWSTHQLRCVDPRGLLINEASFHDIAVCGPEQILEGEVPMGGPVAVIPGIARVRIDRLREEMHGAVSESEADHVRVRTRPFQSLGVWPASGAWRGWEWPARFVRYVQSSPRSTLKASRAVIRPIRVSDPDCPQVPIRIAFADHDGVAGAVGDGNQGHVRFRAAGAADNTIGRTEERSVAHIIALRIIVVPNVERVGVRIGRALEDCGTCDRGLEDAGALPGGFTMGLSCL